MAYSELTWQDLPATITPINAVNLNRMEDGIKQFRLVATTAARDALASPQEGWLCYVTGTDLYYTYTGTAWEPESGQRIASSVLSASAATVDFTSLNQEFSNLRVSYYGRVDVVTALENFTARFNSDSAANYDDQISGSLDAAPFGAEANAATFIRCGVFTGASSPVDEPGGGEFVVPQYRTTTFRKVLVGAQYARREATVNQAQVAGGSWRNTAAINRITFGSTGNFIAGSTFRIYGER